MLIQDLSDILTHVSELLVDANAILITLKEQGGTALKGHGAVTASNEHLPRRQKEVLAWLLEGFNEKQIAYELALSPHTIHFYVKAIYKKYGVKSRSQLQIVFTERNLKTFYAESTSPRRRPEPVEVTITSKYPASARQLLHGTKGSNPD